MVLSDEPSRGFGYLAAAGRLDLTVEALVADASKPYHHLWEQEVVRAAEERLTARGYPLGDRDLRAPADPLAAAAIVETPDGFAVELSVEVTRDGAVRLLAGEASEAADGTLGAVRTFVGL